MGTDRSESSKGADPPTSRLHICLALGTLIVLATAPSSRPASARGELPKVGAQFHAMWEHHWEPGQRKAVLDKLAAAGIKWVRIDVGWSSVQPRGPDSFADWYVNSLERVVRQARARRIKVLLTLVWTPSWANGGRGRNYPPTDYSTFGRFARWIARHFRGDVQAYGVYNEPNLSTPDFWAGTAADYARLLKASYGRFKEGDPDAKVVAGEVVYNDDVWIRQMYEAGAEGYFDVIATHPYPGVADEPPDAPDNGTKWRMTHVPAVHDVMCDFNDCKKPIWFTEFGWSSHSNTGSEDNWERGVTLEEQAVNAVRAIKLVRDRYPYVTHMFWYTERNRTDADPQHNNLGLLRHDLTGKKVYWSVREFLTR
jgi:polysaccharide biosynthesis protein PslG